MRRVLPKVKSALPATTTPAMTRRGLPVWLSAALLLLVTVALYWPAMSYDFVNYDDDLYITSNVHVQRGLTLESIAWGFLNPVAANWHPLTVWSHMLVCQVFGVNPWGHHLFNVLLHALNVGLVFVLLLQLTGLPWRSLVVATFFAVHPLHVESVAWVSERKDVLSGLFGLLALITYTCYAQGRRQKTANSVQKAEGPPSFSLAPLSQLPPSISYLFSLAFFALGLMSKPILVTWPFVMLLLDFWPLHRFEPSTPNNQLLTIGRLAREKIPFFALTVLVSLVTVVAQQRSGCLMAVENLPLGARGANALISYCRYLGKLFWPMDLAVFYPHPGTWPMGKVLLAAGLVIGISMLLLALRRRAPFLVMGWLWFCGMLVPVIGLMQSGGWAMADRHTYLSSIGVLILAVWGTADMSRRWRYGGHMSLLASGVAIAVCLVLTRQQIRYWKDGETLFRHALEATTDNQIAHKVLADALDKKGQTAEALRHYQEAIRLTPGYTDAYNNLGVTLAGKGQTDEALRQFEEAVRLKPNHPTAHYNLGNALDRKGEMDKALHEFQEAVRLNPDYAEAYYNLGIIRARQGQLEEALHQYQEAIRLKPDYAEAHNNLGIALGRTGQMDGAIRQFQEAVRLRPDYAEAHFNLGLALNLKGQAADAIRQFEAALEVKPQYPEAHNYLGTVFSRQGRANDAIQQFQEALKLKPDYAEARANLEAVLAARAHSSPPPSPSTSP